MNNKAKKLNSELIISYGVISLIAAIAIVFLFISFFAIDVKSLSGAGLMATFSILTGAIWGFLLCRSC